MKDQLSRQRVSTLARPVIVFKTKRLSSVLNMKASLFPPESFAEEILARDLW